jgi:hypothetical protein
MRRPGVKITMILMKRRDQSLFGGIENFNPIGEPIIFVWAPTHRQNGDNT